MNTADNMEVLNAENTYQTVEQLKKALADFKGKFNGEQKMLIALDLGVSAVTIERYIRGEVRKAPFARKLIGALNKALND